MGDVAGAEDGFAGLEGDAAVADLEENFAFEYEPEFFLSVVAVEGWAAAFQIAFFDDEKVAGGVGCGDFEGHVVEAAGVGFAEAVFAGVEGVEFG